MNIELGGGSHTWSGWANYDLKTGHEFTPTWTIPHYDNICPIFYSSHCFEHLDDATVAQLLRESYRVLEPGGRLLLKLPDWEQIPGRLADDDAAWFDRWNIQSVTPTWHLRDVADTLPNRAGMIYCGVIGKDGYIGPSCSVNPSVDLHPFVQMLTKAAWVQNPDDEFIHRNAWSRPEMIALLKSHGFTARAPNPHEVIYDWRKTIPDIADMWKISTYYAAAKTLGF